MTSTGIEPSPRRPARAFSRLAAWLDRRTRMLTLANIVAQGALIVTGGIVRLSKSGLGCTRSWVCEDGSLLPTDVAEGNVHPYIEFGNRVVVFGLSLIAVALAIAVWRTRPDLRALGLVPFAGVVVQAVLGAALVDHQLPPLLVGTHMIISVALVWASVQLSLRWRHAPIRTTGPSLRLLRIGSLVVFAVLIVLGTFTTGTGPHSGDDDVTSRLSFDPTQTARAHSLAVWAFTAIIAALAFALWRRREASERVAQISTRVLLISILVEGLVGYIQYFTGRPVGWVAIHLAGIAVLTAAHSATFYLTHRD